MFDLIVGDTKHLPRHQAGPILISTAIQSLGWAVVIVLPLLVVTQSIPDVPTMMAFVATAPAPPPPPPPPAAPRAEAAAAKPAATAGTSAPVEAPTTIAPEPVAVSEGVPGGVEGGVPGGVVGGIVGGLPTDVPPPPPPPPAPTGPVRIGGQLQAPALLHRVEPEYPDLAVRAHLQGLVILEATVNENGQVEDVKVLRSDAPLLDGAAITAVKQWRYAPLTLNGKHEPFILTVMLSFHLTQT